MKWLLVYLIFGIWWTPVFTQENEIDLEKFAEHLFQTYDESVAYEDIYESLFLFYTDPIDLNNTHEEELAQLYILSPLQISSLLDHLKHLGPLTSIYELQSIENFDLPTIRSILPFVTIRKANNTTSLLNRFSKSEKFLLYRQSQIVEKQAGFREEKRYAGSRQKIYMRFRAHNTEHFSLGLTLEKDAGETFGPDFYSFHGMIKNQGSFSKILIGDFQLQIGQGLVMGAGFSPGKGAETVLIVKRNTLGIRRYTSVLETGFFRGVSASTRLGKFKIIGLVSGLKQDGNLEEKEVEGHFEQFVTSIQTSGLHRTESEIQNKDQVLETNLGLVTEFKPNRKIGLGITLLETSFSKPIMRRSQPYNRFEFKGNRNTIIGTFGSYQWQNMSFFGESARSSSGGIGATGGVLASFGKNLDVAVSLRHFDRNFHSMYGRAFGEGLRNINEKGTYWGLKFQPTPTIQVSAYYDKFKFPWLRFRVDSPSQGSEWLGRLTYDLNESASLFFQMRQEVKQFSREARSISNLTDRIKRNYIFNFSIKENSRFTFRTRIQTSTQHFGTQFTKGFALIQDLNYSSDKFSISGRMALFDTDDFDNRQYIFEKDVLYSFSIPAYSGQGIRNYLLIQYRFSNSLKLWVRLARFSYENIDTVGSGLDENLGSNRTEIKWMLRCKF